MNTHTAPTIADELAPSAVKVTPVSIQIGTRVARTLFVSTFPRYLNVGWFSPIVNFDEEFDASISINPEDPAATLKRLRDQLARLESEAMEEQAAGKVRNPMLETAMGDIEQLRDQLQQGTDRFFKVGIYIT